MDFIRLFRESLAQYLEPVVDGAGIMLTGPAWAVIKPAMKPIIDRLEHKLDRALTTSDEQLEQAVEQFEGDDHMQQMFVSAVLEGLGPRLDAMQQMRGDLDEGLWQLLTVVVKARSEIDARLQQLNDKIDRGVLVRALSDEALTDLVQIVREQVLEANRAHQVATGVALDFDRPRVLRLAYSAQQRGLNAIMERRPQRALDELELGMLAVSTLLREAPADVDLRLLLGFLLKTRAQALERLGRPVDADRQRERALTVFEPIEHATPNEQRSARQLAVALVGLAAVLGDRGQPDRALVQLRRAATLDPDNLYIWHDLIAVHVNRARRDGKHDLDEVDRALNELERLDPTHQRITMTHLATLRTQVDALR